MISADSFARPQPKLGLQIVVRKKVYRLMQEAYCEEDIEFALRNMPVYMPPDPNQGEDKKGTADDETAKKKEAGATAAISAIAQEEKQAAAEEEKGASQ